MKLLSILASILLTFQTPISGTNHRKIFAGGGGGGTISFRHSISVDSGTVGTISALDFGQTIPSTSLIVISVTFSGGGGTSVSSICDSTTSSACTVSASTYSSLTKATSGGSPNTQFWYTCNAAASVRFFTVVLSGAEDETVTVNAFNHTVTASCADAHPAKISGVAGATLTSNTYTTAVANEVALSSMADDANCGPSWTGAAGSGFTLAAIASSCSSMLGVTEYKIYTTTQTSVTSTLTTGNTSGNTVAFDTATFE